MGCPGGRRGQELPLQATPRLQREAQTGQEPRAGPGPFLPLGHKRPDAPHRRLPWQVSVCSHQLWARWALECCSGAPWLAQPGVSHTQSLTSFSAHFILLPTHCLLRSLLPTRRSTRPGFPGAAWGMFPQLGEPPVHRTQVTTLQTVEPEQPLKGGGHQSAPWRVTPSFKDKTAIRRCLRKRRFSFGVCK